MTLSAATLSRYYCRLHAKLSSTESIFDSSWAAAPIAANDQFQWTLTAFQLNDTDTATLGFENFIDRLLLLSAAELRRIVCALGALQHQQHLRFCIDGSRLRPLQALIGPIGYAQVMAPADRGASRGSQSAWTVESLCIDGTRQLMSNAMDMHPITLLFLKVGLPRNHVVAPAETADTATELPLTTLRAWFPELRWLFG